MCNNADERAESGDVFRAVAVRRRCRVEAEVVAAACKMRWKWRARRRAQHEGLGPAPRRTRVSDRDDSQRQRFVHGQSTASAWLTSARAHSRDVFKEGLTRDSGKHRTGKWRTKRHGWKNDRTGRKAVGARLSAPSCRLSSRAVWCVILFSPAFSPL